MDDSQNGRGGPMAQWRHDLRDAVATTVLSSSAARMGLDRDNPELTRIALARIDTACARCIKLLEQMPQWPPT
ncbi:MAG TPA: hypothetical protein VGH81_12625 [Rudaea sp.]|jgi:hypothetical protein